ncbi:hypothetical protein [Paenibacillus sp. Z3-2]
MKKIIRFVLLMVLTTIFLVSCNDNNRVWNGKSEHWNATFQSNGEYTIQYIGTESVINDFSYKFSTDNNLNVYGNMSTLSPKTHIKAQVITDNNISDGPIYLKINWNDKDENLILENE